MIKKIEWSIENKLIAAGFSIALCLTGFASLISYQNTTESIDSAANVERAHRVLSNLNDIMAILLDAESGRRGYLLFEDTTELQRYQAASKSINPKLDRLQQWFDMPSDRQKLANLQFLIAKRLDLSERSLDLYQQEPNATLAQASLLIEHKKNRAAIRHIVTEIETNEKQLLQQSIAQYQLNTQSRITIETLSTFLSFAVIFGMFALVYLQMVKRQQAELCQHTLAQEKELSELKLRFFTMVSHEFRTPLSIILGSAQLLGDDEQEWTQERKITNLERIQSSARSMNQLLTDILTLTRAEAGKLEFQPTLMDVETFCINLIEDIKLCWEADRVVKFISYSYCPHVRLDEKLVYSILSNLLTNAIKYSPPGGTIEFILRYEHNEIIFQVRDRGIGIPLEVQSNLYEPFYRADNVGTIEGTGLGLAVVKKCVDLHQGSIRMESTVGIGTNFTVTIPQTVK